MAARLVAEEGLLKGLILPFEEGEEWVIGRDPDACQLLLEDPSASRKHLLCRSTPDGIVLENISKTNPVQINNEELLEPRLLKEGDTVKIGSGVYRYMMDTSTPVNPTPTHLQNPLAEEQKAVAAEKIELPTPAVEPVPVEPKHDSILEEAGEGTEAHKFPEINFDVIETGRWLLKVISGPNHGAEFSMQPGSTYLIGTDPNSCDIVFHDTSVSRQHARISIQEDETIFIEDLKSRNGTLVDGQPIKDKTRLNPNTIVMLGTTSFVIYDREGNMQTIISPLLPSIVKALQKEPAAGAPKEGEKTAEDAAAAPTAIVPAPHKERPLGALILISIITGVFVIVAIGTTTLFKSEPIVAKATIDADKVLPDVFAPYPSLKYSFNKGSGHLVLFGHLLTSQDKTQLQYQLQNLPFIKSVDDSGVVIDEYIWHEINLVLSKNPKWHSITVQSPSAGIFVLTGSLDNRKDAEQLYDYIANNFPYLDRLEKKVYVIEDIDHDAQTILEKAGVVNAKAIYENGDLTISGGLATNQVDTFKAAVEELKQIPGVRNLRNQVNTLAPEQALINLSDRYEVTGFSRIGGNISVVINGRIVTKGDILDGMTIQDIVPGSVYLEKDAVKYRIDFAK